MGPLGHHLGGQWPRIAGCMYSVPFTKIYLQPEMTKFSKKHKTANFKLFIDDTFSMPEVLNLDEVLLHLIPAVVDFAKAVARLRLKLSSKAVIVATNAKLALLLPKEFATYGIFLMLQSLLET